MDESCEFSYNSDLYGIGIRIGLYCQWLTLLIAKGYLPQEIAQIQAMTQIFQTAILISLVTLTMTHSISQPEVLVVLPLCFGGFLTSCNILDPRDNSDSMPRRLMDGLNMGALIAYSSWYWLSGCIQLQAQRPGCVYVTLLFYRWNIMKLRMFGIVMSLIGSIGFLFLFQWFVRRVLALLEVDGVKKTLTYLIQAEGRAGSAELVSRLRWQTWLYTVLVLLAQAHVAAMVELTLVWNSSTKADIVLAAGQMIPLLIGGFGMIRILYLLFTTRYNERS